MANLGLVVVALSLSTSFGALAATPPKKKVSASAAVVLWFGEQLLDREEKIDPLVSAQKTVHRSRTSLLQLTRRLTEMRADAIARESLNSPDQPAMIQVDFVVYPIDAFRKSKVAEASGAPNHWGEASLLSKGKSQGTPHPVRNIVLSLAREIVSENTFAKINMGTDDLQVVTVGKELRLTLSKKVSRDVLNAFREEGVRVGAAFIHLRVSDGMELAEFKYEGLALREFLGLSRGQNFYQDCRLSLKWLPEIFW